MFATDVAAYAVMSNHYYLVVYVYESEVLAWSVTYQANLSGHP
jgi:hypothetical protein